MGHDGQADFDFLFGTWAVRNRRLRRPRGEGVWEAFEGTLIVRPLWGGLANMDEYQADSPSGPLRGVTVRLYDPAAGQWHIHWTSGAYGPLGSPTVGEFRDGRGEFYDQDRVEDRMVLVRYVWSDITATTCHWEQAFSHDGGRTWDDDWLMDYTRVV